MKCTQCGHDMTQSASGWLCFSCGHMEPLGDQASAKPSTPTSPEPEPTPPARPMTASVSPTVPAGSPPAPSDPVEPAFTPASNEQSPSPAASNWVGAAPTEAELRPAPAHPRSKAKLIALVSVVALVLVLGGGGVFAVAVAPSTALGSYLGQLVGIKTSTYSYGVSLSSPEGYDVTLKASGKENVTDPKNPQVDMTLTGKVGLSGSAAALTGAGPSTGTLAAQLRVVANTLYVKLDSFSLLTALLPVKISDSWYKYDLSTANATSKCSLPTNQSGTVLGNQILTKFPVKQTAFKGIDTINGTQMMHYVGMLDNSKLQGAIDAANKGLSADCKIDITADDFKNIELKYDIWRGWGSDRLQLNVYDTAAKTKATITLDTSGYNKPVTITAPTGAQDISGLLGSLMGDTATGTGTSTSTPRTRKSVPATTATVQQQARDTQRKSDLRMIRNGLEEYYITNNYYPSSLGELTKAVGGSPAILKTLPVDPTAKSPYTYLYVPPSIKPGQALSYKLLGCLENAADVSANVVDPVAPCKTATFELTSPN